MTEKSIKKSDADLKTIFNKSQLAIEDFTYDWEYWLDPNGRYLYVSPSCERITGYSPDEFLQDPTILLKFVHPEDQEMVSRHFSVVLKDEKVASMDFRILTRNGEERWIHHICQSVYSRQGDCLGRRASNRDITERKYTEEALRKERDKIQKYLNIAEVILIVIDSQQKVSLINKKGCEILGYSEEDILGQNWFDQFIPQSDRENVRAGFFKLMNGEMPFMEYFENSVLTKGGEERLIAWHNSILTDHSARITGTLSSGQDITERKLAEEKLQQTMRELKRSNAELEQFAYVTSHDLQQPLTMIDYYAQLLTQRYSGQFDAEADRFIARIQEGVEQMQHMIKDLLDYSRMDAKRAELQPIESELLLSKALDNLHTVIEEHQAAISSTPLPRIIAVEVQFVQLFQNLVGNAIKFQSDASPRIHVSVEQGENEWIFSVQDNGIGIAAEDVERIFTIFERLHSRSKYPGTGIGLAICKKIVERHGGRIWVESQPGQGSTFYFTSPTNS